MRSFARSPLLSAASVSGLSTNNSRNSTTSRSSVASYSAGLWNAVPMSVLLSTVAKVFAWSPMRVLRLLRRCLAFGLQCGPCRFSGSHGFAARSVARHALPASPCNAAMASLAADGFVDHGGFLLDFSGQYLPGLLLLLPCCFPTKNSLPQP